MSPQRSINHYWKNYLKQLFLEGNLFQLIQLFKIQRIEYIMQKNSGNLIFQNADATLSDQ